MNNLPPILQDIIDRLVLINEFQNGQPQLDGAPNGQSLINIYQPHDLISFNLNRILPEDHLAVKEYQQVITVPAVRIPTFVAPNINQDFPQGTGEQIQEPENTSFLRLLIPMIHANVVFSNYNFICERNSLRRIGMNNEEYGMGVIRYGNTLLLRRYDRQISMDTNSLGIVFKQMCTPDYPPGAGYKKLIEGNIGNLRTLITAEIDAVSQDNGNPIELKCKKEGDNRHFDDIWLQAYLSGIETVTIGYRSNDRPPRLIELNNRPTNQMIDEQRQINILQRIHQVLLFLQRNVEQKRSYLLISQGQPQNMRLFLYEVTNQNDQQRLTFAPEWLFNRLGIDIN